jgi:4-amino-4-deoxy-L-arabinose transferase-like glycosyltransferase
MFTDYAGFDIDNLVYGRVYLYSLAGAFAIGDLSPYMARLVSFASGLVALVALYGLGRELWNERVGLVAAVLLAVSPVFIAQSHDARPEIMQIAVTLVAFYLMLLAERRRSGWLLVTSGLIASLAADVHFNGLVVPVALLAVLVVRRASRRSVVLFFSGTALGGMWWLFVHVLPDPSRFLEQTRTFGFPTPAIEMLSEPILVLGMEIARYLRVDAGSLVLLAVGLFAGYSLLRRHRDRSLLAVLTYAGVVALFMLLIVGNKLPIYAVLLWPVLALLVSRRVDVADHPRLAATVTVAIIAASLASVGSMAIRDRNADYDGYIAQLRAAIPASATVVGQPSVWFGFADQPYVITETFVHVQPVAQEMRRLGVEYVIADEFLMDSQFDVFQDLPAAEVRAFLAEHGEVVAEITDPYYGRLQIDGEPPVTRVYRIE